MPRADLIAFQAWATAQVSAEDHERRGEDRLLEHLALERQPEPERFGCPAARQKWVNRRHPHERHRGSEVRNIELIVEVF
jgi:hypothetical protein